MQRPSPLHLSSFQCYRFQRSTDTNNNYCHTLDHILKDSLFSRSSLLNSDIHLVYYHFFKENISFEPYDHSSNHRIREQQSYPLLQRELPKQIQQSIDLPRLKVPFAQLTLTVEFVPAHQSHSAPHHSFHIDFDIHFHPNINLRSPLRDHLKLLFRFLRNIYFFIRSKSLNELNYLFNFALKNPLNPLIELFYLHRIQQ